MLVATAGNLLSEGKVDMEEAARGAAYLAAISPVIGTTYNLWTHGIRHLFGIESVIQEAQKKEC